MKGGLFKKRAIPARVRRDVAARHGGRPNEQTEIKCHYCGAHGSMFWFRYSRGLGWPSFSLELDHVEPESVGGETTAENIVLACRPCNRGKGPRRPEEWRP
jgi:5-methylcytosine-specific restriction endonuclease McrA